MALEAWRLALDVWLNQYRPMHVSAIGIETQVLNNPGPREIRPFCQTQNPGLRAAEPGFRVCVFWLHSVHFNSRSCNSLMYF